MPMDAADRTRYRRLQRERVERLGGVGPRALPAVTRQPSLPRIIHVHVDQGFDHVSVGQHLGVYGEDVLTFQDGCRLNRAYLRSRGLDRQRKVLVFGGTDPILRRICQSADQAFFESLRMPNVTAIISPFLSDYQHGEHRVGLDNRSIAQSFMGALLRHHLPGVFFTYLDRAVEYEDWLVEYFLLNPTQQYIATGFDRGAANNLRFWRDRIAMLQAVEARLGRPLRLVLSGVLTRLPFIRAASDAFPHRLHLLGQSVFLRSVNGSRLVGGRPSTWLRWKLDDRKYIRGWPLFDLNRRTLEQAIREEVDSFGDSASSQAAA